MLGLAELVGLKRQHILRLANQNGAMGEAHILSDTTRYVPRPRGRQLSNLMAALQDTGIVIKKASFDAIALPDGCSIDFSDPCSVQRHLAGMTFVEIKTANQARVRADFAGFFFAFTEGEILASEALGDRYKVLLINKTTGTVLLTSVPEILGRSKSLNWQVSVQL
jgi:hypothetical protein